MQPKRNTQYGICEQCQSPFSLKRRNRKSANRFCSHACQGASMKRPASICAHCGNAYDNNGHKERRYCSQACSHAARVIPVEERFWIKVDTSGECWEWMGCIAKDGYGHFTPNHGDTPYPAHRFGWELTYGKITNELKVLHKCDNRKCVRPEHLFLGTHADNTQDMMTKKRNAFGERHGMAKLAAGDVRRIRAMFADGYGIGIIASHFPVHPNHVKAIIDRRFWKHID